MSFADVPQHPGALAAVGRALADGGFIGLGPTTWLHLLDPLSLLVASIRLSPSIFKNNHFSGQGAAVYIASFQKGVINSKKEFKTNLLHPALFFPHIAPVQSMGRGLSSICGAKSATFTPRALTLPSVTVLQNAHRELDNFQNRKNRTAFMSATLLEMKYIR